ncbi:AlpA family transcriptional regulator [Vibrio fluvialis]|uniref:helix-turn-helix transcriptional regulator n=1 Tax=Vibrio fluvialis TaxID=676 RepID=UPI001F3CD1C4|nr:AlpA family transcriptional regulator [Vibrio fluvialis]MCE7611110.1 AlpA family transcriptional regulator [Vibrio fluvialis]MCE7617941.1 AlpA family transcriptional regulator [Vibrio fluvialis]MCE7627603.1 AlpA family transcriptional regulator [Vibrio fluvialis]
MSNKIIRLPEVIDKTGLSRSTIYLRMSKGEFPPSVSLGERAVGWVYSDIEQWLGERIKASKKVGGMNEKTNKS